MKDLETPSPGSDKYDEMNRQIDKALRRCGRDVLIRHKREGFPIVSWKDGKVVLIPPEEIVIPPAEE